MSGAPEAWESSHLGGDRFAPNLVVVPTGAYYGRVPPERADELLDATRQGRIVSDLYRGRVVFGFAEQAGEAFLRAATGTDRVEAVELLDATRAEVGPDRSELTVRFAVDGVPQPPILVRGHKGDPRLLTCRGRPAKPWEFTVSWAAGD
jgi:(2Fe-2S) ferredoxin